jgi:uncharacterized protein
MKMSVVAKFLVFTFLIAWVCWFTLILLARLDLVKYCDGMFMILYIIGGICPSFVGFLAIRGDQTHRGLLKMEIIRFRLNILWYLFIVLVPLLLSGVAWFVNCAFGNNSGSFLTKSIWSVFAILPIMIIGGGLEEIGWRGVLLAKLLEDMPALKATFLVALIWSLWHLPLWLIAGLPQYGSNFIYFLAGAFSLSVFLTIVYIKTRSLFICILFHALENAYLSIGMDSWIRNATGGLIFIIVSLIIPIIGFGLLKLDRLATRSR